MNCASISWFLVTLSVLSCLYILCFRFGAIALAKDAYDLKIAFWTFVNHWWPAYAPRDKMLASYKLWLAISKIFTPVKGSTKGSILIIWSSSSYLFFSGSLGISSESESSFAIGIFPISWFESALRLLFLVPFVANLSMLMAAKWSSSSRCLAMLTFSLGFFCTLIARSFGYIGTEPRCDSKLYLKKSGLRILFCRLCLSVDKNE